MTKLYVIRHHIMIQSNTLHFISKHPLQMDVMNHSILDQIDKREYETNLTIKCPSEISSRWCPRVKGVPTPL